MQRFARLVFLSLLAIAAQPVSAQKTTLKVTLASAIPEQLFLEQQTAVGWQALDSAWPASDGLYYLDIKGFHPGLFQLRLGNLGTLPLLLSQHRKSLTVSLQGPEFISNSCVEDDCSATAYLHALRLQEQANYWGFLAAQAKKIDDAAPASLSIMDSLATAARLRLNSYVDSTVANTPDTLLRHFLHLSQQPLSAAAQAWWPSSLLQDSLIAHTDALRKHTQAYFYAQLDDAYSRPRVDSAFAFAVRSLAKMAMHPTVAQRLRAYTMLFFTESHYPEAARIATLEPFGPLQPTPLLAPAASKCLSPKEALQTKVRALNGKAIPLVNQKTQYTLVILWSVWCPHCQTLLPQIHEWWSRLPKGQLGVLAISIDRPEKALITHIKLKGWGWRNAVEEDNDSSTLLERIGFDGTPQLVLFDSCGNTVTQPQTLTQLQNQF